jgi:type III secretory pathway component EscU
MNKWLELVLGILLIIAPIWITVVYLPNWGIAALQLVMGGVIVGVIVVGILFLVLGISDLKA